MFAGTLRKLHRCRQIRTRDNLAVRPFGHYVNLILKQDIEKLGNRGDEVRVKAGYARNYLYPEKLAVYVTPENQKAHKINKESSDELKLDQERDLQKVIKKMTSIVLLFKRHTPSKREQTFSGAITAPMVSDMLLRQHGLLVGRARIQLPVPITNLGDHVIKVRVDDQVETEFLEKEAAAQNSETNNETPLQEDIDLNQAPVVIKEATNKLEVSKQTVNLKVKLGLLHERFLQIKELACCHTMDLIAVLSFDCQIAIYRTISWTRVAEISSADLGSSSSTMTWSPDGYRLGIGCLDGGIHIFDMESLEVVPKLADWEQSEKLFGDNFRHHEEIVSMHWIRYNLETSSEIKAPSSHTLESYSTIVKKQCRKQIYDNEYCPDPKALLITADLANHVKFWIMDTICLLSVFIPDLLGNSSFSIRSIGVPTNASNCFATGRLSGEKHSSQCVVALDLPLKDRFRICSLGISVKQAQLEFDKWTNCVRQMQIELNNAMKVLNIKMEILGSLYQKYAREELPQADLFSLYVTGMATPVLTQYFANELKEASVYRMQKEMLTGLAKLLKSARRILIPGCHVLLQVCRSLRHLFIDGDTFEEFFGVSNERLQNLIRRLESFRFTLEHFVIATQKAQQDFFLFFVWLLEQVVIHTRSDKDSQSIERILADVGRHKSISNQRQLGFFLENAITIALHKRENGSKTMELTIGNPIIPFFVPDNMQAEGCCHTLTAWITDISKEWMGIFSSMVEHLSGQVIIDLDSSLVFDGIENECTLDFEVSSPEMEEFHTDELDEETLSYWMEKEAHDHRYSDVSSIMIPVLSMKVDSKRLLVCRYANNHWEYRYLEQEFTNATLIQARYWGHSKAKIRERFALLFSRRQQGNGRDQDIVCFLARDAKGWSPLMMNRGKQNQICSMNTDLLEVTKMSCSQMNTLNPSIVECTDLRLWTSATRGIICVLRNLNHLMIYDAEE